MRAVGSNEFDTERLQFGEAYLLHHEIAGKPAGGLNNDGAGAVAGDVGEHGSEAGACFDVIRAADCRVGELSDKLKPHAFGVGDYGLPLTLIAVLLGPNIRCARSANIGDRFGSPAGAMSNKSLWCGFLH